MGTKKVEDKQSKMQKKKRRLIVMFCIIGILLMLVVGFFVGKLVYHLMEEKGSLKDVEMNILHLGEQTNRRAGGRG
ncbi:MAG: preprotein translocase subunit TatC [Clostridia bacterium]|nr:preprotein translocase subunit TatC [Clostridia bacterium]